MTENFEINHSLMTHIDSHEKAYFLGWVAGVGIIVDSEIFMEFKEKDIEIVNKLKDFVSPQIPISKQGTLISFVIKSKTIANDIVNHLKCPLKFPEEINYQLKWDFTRGFFDCIGDISQIFGYPKCTIVSSYIEILEDIKNFCGVKSIINSEKLEWTGINAIDFLSKIYLNASIYNSRKYNIFIKLSNQLLSCSLIDRLPSFKWSRTIPEGIKPSKNRFSDSGFDLHLVKKIKIQGGVHFFDTGIQIQPENSYYFDLVGRSSISKTGWMLANNIGIIDASYTGSVIVALVKIDPEAPELELPCKLVQIIPRQLILMEAIEVDSLDDTERGGKGFGSSNQ
jgi:dUTPase